MRGPRFLEMVIHVHVKMFPRSYKRSYSTAFTNAFTPYKRPRQAPVAALVIRNQRRRSFPSLRYPGSGVNRGFTRSGGFYGRFGGGARRLGNIEENKFLDTTLGFNFDTTAEVPATGQLALIPQDDTQSGRDGRRCIINSIHIRANLTLVPGAAALPSGITKLILVQDTQTNGAAAAVADVFTGSLSTSMLNLSNSMRFKILKSWTHSWNPKAGVTTAFNNDAKHIDKFIKCNIPLEFNGATGAITEMKSNNIFLLAQASVSAIDDLVVLAGTCRIRFKG